MRRTIYLGKIAYNYAGRIENKVTIEIELKEKENGQKVFSASGNIWNRINTDILSGGQNLDEIAKTGMGHNPKFKEVYRLWKLYHLNDMHPECEHQEQAGWRTAAAEEITIYKYFLTSETRDRQKEIKQAIMDAALWGNKTYQPTEEEKKIVTLAEWLETDSELSEDLKPFYKLHKTEKQRRGWTRYDEFKSGILCKPCPICGYKYGSSWTYREIPQEDLTIIENLLKGEQAK